MNYLLKQFMYQATYDHKGGVTINASKPLWQHTSAWTEEWSDNSCTGNQYIRVMNKQTHRVVDKPRYSRMWDLTTACLDAYNVTNFQVTVCPGN